MMTYKLKIIRPWRLKSYTLQLATSLFINKVETVIKKTLFPQYYYQTWAKKKWKNRMIQKVQRVIIHIIWIKNKKIKSINHSRISYSLEKIIEQWVVQKVPWINLECMGIIQERTPGRSLMALILSASNRLLVKFSLISIISEIYRIKSIKVLKLCSDKYWNIIYKQFIVLLLKKKFKFF